MKSSYYGKVKPVTLEYYRKPLNFDQKFYGKPGAGLDSSGLDEGRVQIGQKGEQRVGEELERIAALYPNMYVFHSVKLYGSIADIDHVVVQGKKVLLVDTKNWAKGHKYEITTVYNEQDEYTEHDQFVNTIRRDVHRKPYKEYFVKRDGNNFTGGTIHLPFYMEKWDKNLKNNLAYPKMEPVESVLVMANEEEAVWSDNFDRSFWFSNMRQLEYVFQNVFTDENVAPIDKRVLRFFMDRVQASVTTEVAEKAREESYFAYQVDSQPMSSATTAMVYAIIAGVVGSIFHWWAFVIGMCIFALISGVMAIFVLNPKREASYKKGTKMTKFLSVFVIFFLYFAITSAMK